MLVYLNKLIKSSLVFLIIVIFWRCSGPPAETSSPRQAISVAVSEVGLTDLIWVRSYNGSLAGIRQAEPTAKLSETITAIRVKEGDQVTAGEVIVEFDKYGPSSRLRQAEAAFLEAQRNYEKYQRLLAGGAVAQREFDFAETQFKIARADFEAARNQVRVKSPIAGLVTDIYVKIGQQARAGEVLAVIAALDTMRLTFDVPYFDAREIKKGAAVRVRSELDTTLAALGWVFKISESAHPVTRTITVEVLITNSEHLLHPGMFVTGEIVLRQLVQVLTISGEALIERGGRRGVFVVSDSLARFMPVETGLTVDQRTRITAGLSTGDRVVTSGQHSLQDGALVSVESPE